MARNLSAQKGNVLFLILIAVALFAALSYVITNSSRSGGGNTSADQGKMVAADFISYGVEIRAAIQRMMIQNGCTDTEINFSNPYFGTYYDNPNAPASKKCNIFDKEGGGVAFRQIKVTKSYFRSPELIGTYNVLNIGTTEPDLLLVLFMQPDVGSTNVNMSVCKAIFDMNHMNVPAGSYDVVTGGGGVFKGTYTAVDTIGDTLPALKGQDIGCWSGGPDQWYSAYFVLLAR